MRLFHRSRAEPMRSDESAERSLDQGVEHAWRTLALINEWIRHSDAKAGVTLAFAGALGAMTFNLARGFEHESSLFDVLVVLICVTLVVTVLLCGWTLTPRVGDRDAEPDSVNRLYFGSILRHFKGERSQYREAARELIANPFELIGDLADQTHANARIAAIKTRAVTWAIRCALVGGLLVSALAATVGIVDG